MLPKKRRMASREVNEVFSRGKYLKTRLFSVKYLPGPQFSAAVAPAKAAFKLAVLRNKARRMVYGAIGTITPLPTSGTYVFIPEKTLIESTILEIAEEITYVFKKTT